MQRFIGIPEYCKLLIAEFNLCPPENIYLHGLVVFKTQLLIDSNSRLFRRAADAHMQIGTQATQAPSLHILKGIQV